MIAPDPAALPIRAQILGVQAGVETHLRAPTAEPTPGRTAPSPLPWQPGERLQAQVQAALPGGRFLVRIAEFDFDMQLPARARVGDQLQLTYAGSTPRPQFVLAQDDAPGSGAARLDLSREGRALAAALAARGAQPPEAPTARPSVPLLPTPAPLLQSGADAAAPLAAALRTALDSSGLFYESHLAEWVEGRRPLEGLMREPQAQLRGTPVAVPEDTSEPTGRERSAPASRAGERAEPPPPRAAPGPTVSQAAAAAQPEHPVIHPRALPLVSDQLHTLDTGQLLWSGQAWPGQALEWRLHPLDDESARAAGEPLPWATQLRLTFPRLGAVTADLQLSGSSLRLEVRTAEPSAGAELEAARTALAGALADAGLRLVRFATTLQDERPRDG